MPIKKHTIRLQIVSPNYQKRPYIKIPTAVIDASEKVKLLASCQKAFQKKKVQEFRDILKWDSMLKCHPAMAIGIGEPSTKSEETDDWLCFLFVYPRSYRKILEDPFMKIDKKVVFLGTQNRIVIYGVFNQKANKDDLINTIIDSLKLVKNEKPVDR